MNLFWFCYSPNPCHPSLSKKQNVFLLAWKKEGDIVNSSSVSLGWDSTQILPPFMSLFTSIFVLFLAGSEVGRMEMVSGRDGR